MGCSSEVLAVVSTHPVQYHAPVFRAVERQYGCAVHLVYGADFSLQSYEDKEFGLQFSWDCPLVCDGDRVTFLSRVLDGGARSFEEVRSTGIGAALDRIRPAAVLLTGYWPRFHLDALLAARRRRIPVLLRAETTDHTRQRRSWHDWLLRRIYGQCEFLLPIGKRSRAHYERLGVRAERMVASPYCVDESVFQTNDTFRTHHRASVRQELGISAGARVVLYSGKLSARKGVSVLVEAVGRLEEGERRKTVVLMVGHGALAEDLRQHAASIGVKLCLAGFQNQSRLSQYYSAADIFCLPSIQGETWGLVVNEALLHGLPCVVSDAVGCAPDLIENGQTGFAAPAGDALVLRQALRRCLDLADTPGVRQACQEMAARYSVAVAARGIAEAFRRVTAAEQRWTTA